MPSNSQARQLAVTHGATITPYVQAEGNCDGIVSWWLRSRLQDKDIWRPKYFEATVDGRQIATDHYSPGTDVVERTDKGLEKARALQGLFYNNRDDRAYITRGVRSDKSDKAEKTMGKFVRPVGPEPINDFSTHGDNAGNICRSFISLSLERYAAKYTITSSDNHALGLDCLASPSVRYFDPNIGEFIFRNVESLIRWWRECYQRRGTGGGAFGIMLNSYKADLYRRLAKGE